MDGRWIPARQSGESLERALSGNGALPWMLGEDVVAIVELTEAELGAFERAKAAGYLVHPPDGWGWPVSNAWRVWCELQAWPAIEVRGDRTCGQWVAVEVRGAGAGDFETLARASQGMVCGGSGWVCADRVARSGLVETVEELMEVQDAERDSGVQRLESSRGRGPRRVLGVSRRAQGDLGRSVQYHG